MGYRQSLGTFTSNAKRRARSNARFDRIAAASARGDSKADAAAEVGLTIDGLNSLLKRKGYTKAWPIVEDTD